MKKIFVTATIQMILILLLFMNSRAQQTIDLNLAAAKKAIAASNELYFQAFRKGDSSLLIGRYAKDCWIMPPNAPALCGADAPLEFFNTAYHQLGLRNGKLITVDVFGDGVEFVTEIGFWQLLDASNQISDQGKFLVLWKKGPDGWKMFRDSFSSDREAGYAR